MKLTAACAASKVLRSLLSAAASHKAMVPKAWEGICPAVDSYRLPAFWKTCIRCLR